MKKFLVLIAICAFVLYAVPSNASVGIKRNNQKISTATDLNVQTTDAETDICSGLTCTINSASLDLVAAGASNGGAVSMTSSETDIDVGYALIRKAISNAAQTSTLPDGIPGQFLTIIASSVVASGTWTVTPTTSSSISTFAFDAAKDQITLLFADTTTGWVVVGDTAVTITYK